MTDYNKTKGDFVMKKIKILSLILTALMIMCVMTGCGSSKGDNNSNITTDISTNPVGTTSINNTENIINASDDKYIYSKETFVEKMSALIDVSLYTLDENNSGTFSIYSYNIQSDKKTATNLDCTVKIYDGTEITMPISVKEFKNKGWNFKHNDSENNLGAGLLTFSAFENADGKNLSADLFNSTDRTVTFEEATITGIESQQYSTSDHNKKIEGALDFKVCNSITNDSSLVDIISVLGNPTSVICSISKESNGQYKYSKVTIKYEGSSSYNYLEFELSGDNNRILTMEYDCDVLALARK